MLNGVKRMKSTVSFSAMKRQREREREREKRDVIIRFHITHDEFQFYGLYLFAQ